MATHSPHPPGSNLLYSIFFAAEQKRYQNTVGTQSLEKKRNVEILRKEELQELEKSKKFSKQYRSEKGHAPASFAT